MPIEREAKFLVRDPGRMLIVLRERIPAQSLRQGYAPGRIRIDQSGTVVLAFDDPALPAIPPLEVSVEDRTRLASLPDAVAAGIPGPIRCRIVVQQGREEASLTFKTGYDDACLEIEGTVPLDWARTFPAERGLAKTRFTVAAGQGHWDCDLIHRADSERLALGLIEREGYPLGTDPAQDPPDWLRPHLGARVPEAHRDLFSAHALSVPGYAETLLDRYMLGHSEATGPIAGITVFHAKFEHARVLYEAVCGGTDDAYVAAARETILGCHYRAVGRFNTDDLEAVFAMTAHGTGVRDTWPSRPNPDRYRFFSPLNRRVEANSCDGTLMVRAGEGFVVSGDDRRTGLRFLPIGPVDAEAVRLSYPWP
jgi:hypothetical protein